MRLALPFPVRSDAGGEGAIKPFGLWDAAGSMSKPAIIVLTPDGRDVFRYTGVGFMDRPHDDNVLNVLDGIDLPPLTPTVAAVAHLTPASGSQALPLYDLAVYMRGVRSCSQALTRRARDPWDRAAAERTTKMTGRFIAARGATRRLLGSN